MKTILNCILTSSLLFLFLHKNYAQEDSIRCKGLQIGVDLGEILINQTKKGKEDYMLLFDYEFKEDKFAALEVGISSFKDLNEGISFTSKGGYGILGMNLNVREKGMRINEDILFWGFRYGFSYFKQGIDKYTITNYWGNFEGSVENEVVKAHWLEFLFGARAEIWFFKNASASLIFRPKYMVSWTKNTLLAPKFVPGFGKTDNQLTVDINWTISYRIPFKNKKFPKKEKVTKLNAPVKTGGK